MKGAATMTKMVAAVYLDRGSSWLTSSGGREDPVGDFVHGLSTVSGTQ